MTRFYFDVRDDFYSADDNVGSDLAGVETARREAVRLVTSIATDVFNANGSGVTVKVRDDDRALFEVSVSLSCRDFC